MMLHNRVAIVTGASRGLGRAIAARLHAEGMGVALVARSAEVLTSLADDLSEGSGAGRLLPLVVDVADPATVDQAVDACRSELGEIDLLVNNAGIAEADEHRLWEADVEEWWDVVTTNLRAPMLWCRAVIPQMYDRGQGRIINVNSMRGVRALPTQTAYGVSKSALAKFTEVVATSLSGSGVEIFGYSPGRVKTHLTASMGSLAGVPESTWTPIESAVGGIVAIARGEVDGLSGRFLHAHDDWQALIDNLDDIVRNQRRTLILSPAYPGDPLPARQVGGDRSCQSS